MSRRRITRSLLALALALAAAEQGRAQTLPEANRQVTALRIPQLQATTTFRAYDLTASLESMPLAVDFGGASVMSAFRRPSLSHMGHLTLRANQNVANTIYSVRFAIPRASAAGEATISRGNTVIARCALNHQPLYGGSAPVQYCDSGFFTVADGKIDLTIRGAPNQAIDIDQITVSRFQ